METLWSDFLNSEWHDWKGSGYSEDRLGQEKWQTYYLNQWQLKAQVPADDETVGVMRQFRSRLHDMSVRCAAGATLPAEDVDELNRVLDLGPVKRKAKLEGGELGIGLTPVREDWHQVMAEVAASFLRSLIEGEGEGFGFAKIPIADGFSMMIPVTGPKNIAMIKRAVI